MIIATYNLHLGGDGGDLRHWAEFVHDRDVDILFVQESFSPERYQGDIDPSRALWSAVPERDWGSGLYSRYPISERVRLEGFDGWVVGAVVEPPASEPVMAFSVHTPSIKGRSYPVLVAEILDAIAALEWSGPLVLGGDFNLVSTGHRHAAEALQTKPIEQKLLARLQQDFGLVSCWQAANLEMPLAQTLRWVRDRTPAYHADALFIPESWCTSVERCEVLSGGDWNRMSDHNPVLAELGEPPSGRVTTSSHHSLREA